MPISVPPWKLVIRPSGEPAEGNVHEVPNLFPGSPWPTSARNRPVESNAAHSSLGHVHVVLPALGNPRCTLNTGYAWPFRTSSQTGYIGLIPRASPAALAT